MEFKNQKKNGFRINCSKLALTYPQTTLTRESLLYGLEKKLDMLDWLIAQEEHKDGGIHLHAFIELKKKGDWKNPNCFDILGEHGNYQPCHSKVSWIQYCLKEDKTPLQSKDWNGWLKCTLAHRNTEKNLQFLSDAIKLGPKKMVDLGQVSLMNYEKVMRNLKAYQNDAYVDDRSELPDELINPWWEPFKVNTDIKKCHLWVYSRRPNLGKTTWASALLAQYKSEAWNYTEKFQPQMRMTTELVILDEYRGQLKVTELNQLCDGTLYFAAKNCLSWRLNQKALVIVLSNRSIQDLYHKEEDQELLEARFQMIEVNVFRL